MIKSSIFVLGFLTLIFIPGEISPGVLSEGHSGKPNYVSTLVTPEDVQHYIKPIEYGTDREEAINITLEILEDWERCTIVEVGNDVIHAEFRSRFFRFVDDVYISFPDNKNIIHFRSASRIGYSDMGVNRKRMEEFRSRFLRRSAGS